MALTDDQLEQLETYMDGELPAEQEGALLHRLAGEAELASALEAIRGEREVRSAVWRGYEPGDATVQRLVMKIEHAVDRHNVWAHRLAKWRIPSAAAACILIGFMVGWVGRGTTPTNPGAPGGTVFVAENAPRIPQIPTAIPTPRAAPTPRLATVGARSGAVELPIVDDYGRQVGVQSFNSVEEAARFIEDLNRWQRTQEKVKSGNFTLTGEEKF